MTQSIIVYRNPMEQAFWESGMMIPIVGGISAGLLAFAITYKLTDFVLTKFFSNKVGWSKRNQYATNIAAIVGGFVGFPTMFYLVV